MIRCGQIAARDSAVGERKASLEVGDGRRWSAEPCCSQDVGVHDIPDMDKVKQMPVVADLESSLACVQRLQEARNDLSIARPAKGNEADAEITRGDAVRGVTISEPDSECDADHGLTR